MPLLPEEDQGAGVVPFHLGDGQTTVVCGRTTRAAIEAIGLITLVETRCLPSLATEGAPVLSFRDDDLGVILHRLFGRKPKVVAEAIRALRKVSGGRDAWLTKILNGTRELQPLAEAVSRELQGRD